MNPAERLHRLFAYDTWACLRVHSALEENRQFEHRGEAVKMFGHIVSSQLYWYARITEEPEPAIKLWPAPGLDGHRELLDSMNNKWSTLIDKNKKQLDREIVYKNSKGESFRTMLSDILHHVIIHGQHHRAQIAQLLRISGIVPPPTDFIFYLRESGS